MNRVIKPFRFVKDEEIEKAMQRLLSQLENNSYAIISNPPAIRAFSKTIPRYYREKKIILFSTVNGKNIVTLDPAYQFCQKEERKYRITLKTA